MKTVQNVLTWLLVFHLSGLPAVLAQPVLIQPGNPFGNQQLLSSGVENLRVAQQGGPGADAELIMDYSYDGFAGPTAQIIPIIGKKGQNGVGAWFGSDPVMVGRGKGTITLRVRYFNDEPGVPAIFTSDQVRILILNQSGTALITAVPFLKTINWGSPNGGATPKAQPQLAMLDKAAAQKLAKEKRDAEEKARGEAAAREKSRLKAEAEAQARGEAEAKARAEALAREEARKKAQAEADRIALENKKAEERRLVEENAREQARQLAEAKQKEEAKAKALAEAKAAAEAKAVADAQALAEANAREEARLRAAAEQRRNAEEKATAEAKARALAEAQAREEARVKAEAEAKRLAEEKRVAEEKVLAEAKARKEAEEKAHAEALAQAKAELDAKRFAEEKAKAEAIAQAAAPAAANLDRGPVSMDIALDRKTKITNVDVVNRSIDRTQMTFGVEFEYRDQMSDPMIGVEVLRESEPQVSSYFVSRPAEIGKSRRNFALLPVKFQPPAALSQSSDFGTDKVMVYLTDKRAQRYNILPATMLLRWRAPGSTRSNSEVSNANLVEIEDFKQNDPSSGNISVRYNLLGGKGKLRGRIYAEAARNSAAYFSTSSPEIPAGRGVQFIGVEVDPDAKMPTDLIRADTIEVEMLDGAGKILARASKKAAMVWTRPK